MQSKTTQAILIVVVAVLLLGGAFSGGVVAGWLIPLHTLTGAVLPQQAPDTSGSPAVPLFPSVGPTPAPQDTTTLFKPFWDAWSLVHQEFVDQPLNDQTLMRGAIKGMIESLGDTHSSYWDPEVYTQTSAELNGKSYGGIGAWVDTTGEFMRIIAPMSGSPAQKAGLRSGDLVIAVDKEDMTGKPGDYVLQHVLGTAGTPVTLTIARSGEKQPISLVIQREQITVPQAEGKMLDNHIAYIRLYTFGDQTEAQLQAYLKEFLPQKPVGLILDLRNNGGGYLDTSIQVVSEFIPSPNVVMIEEYGDGTRNIYKAAANGLATDIPLVVLVNEGSASASEITAGAIQDYGRGKLVGVKTYGKGSVQQITPLKNDGGAVRITIARWLTPKDRQINKIGLAPDVVVELSADDIQNNRDPQLDKAIQILLNGNK